MSDHQHNHQAYDHNYHDHKPVKKRYIDPICGMATDDTEAFIAYEQDGETYYFCSRHCLEKFKHQKVDVAAIKN